MYNISKLVQSSKQPIDYLVFTILQLALFRFLSVRNSRRPHARVLGCVRPSVPRTYHAVSQTLDGGREDHSCRKPNKPSNDEATFVLSNSTAFGRRAIDERAKSEKISQP